MTCRTLCKMGLGIVGLLLVLFVAAGLFLSQGKTLGERHAAFSYGRDFDFVNSSFADYVAWSRNLLQTARLDAPSQEVIDNLAPFILEPAADCPRDADGKVEKGIVLIHGLIDSPYSMKPLGEHLQSRCFYVLGLLLPDHGLRPGNMLDAHWEDWAALAHFAASQLETKANTLFLSGHSAGGALSILEAANNPEVDALVLFAPALAISPAAPYAQYVALIGKIFSKAAWFDVQPDEAIYRYESFTFTGAAETYALIQATVAALTAQSRQLPVFTVASMQDNTVDTQAILDYMAANTNPLSHTLLYSQHPLPAGEKLEVVSSNIPEQRILSLSHLGLMTPASHPYFGRDGEYRNCIHYSSDDPLYARCKAGELDFYGEITAENLESGVLERISFNPFYETMLERLDGFVQAVD